MILPQVINQRTDQNAIDMYAKKQDRIKSYKEMVSTHYSTTTDSYIAFWSEHLHAAIWKDRGDSIEEALRKTHEMLIEDAKISESDKVIDIGCGVGALSFFVAKTTGCHVTGINLSKYQLEKANATKKKMKIKNVDFLEMDVMNLNELEDKYDAAFLIDTGVHLPDKKKALVNIHKILNKGARLVITDWLQRDKLNDFEEAVFIEPLCKYWAFPYMISLPQYEKILNEVGFKIIKATDVSEDVKKTWEEFYKVALKSVNDMTLVKMSKLVRIPEIILEHKEIALKAMKTGVQTSVFPKICSDAGVLRYGYIVTEK